MDEPNAAGTARLPEGWSAREDEDGTLVVEVPVRRGLAGLAVILGGAVVLAPLWYLQLSRQGGLTAAVGLAFLTYGWLLLLYPATAWTFNRLVVRISAAEIAVAHRPIKAFWDFPTNPDEIVDVWPAGPRGSFFFGRHWVGAQWRASPRGTDVVEGLPSAEAAAAMARIIGERIGMPVKPSATVATAEIKGTTHRLGWVLGAMGGILVPGGLFAITIFTTLGTEVGALTLTDEWTSETIRVPDDRRHLAFYLDIHARKVTGRIRTVPHDFDVAIEVRRGDEVVWEETCDPSNYHVSKSVSRGGDGVEAKVKLDGCMVSLERGGTYRVVARRVWRAPEERPKWVRSVLNPTAYEMLASARD